MSKSKKNSCSSPRIYHDVANVIRANQRKTGSLRSLIYSPTSKLANPKATYRLAHSVLQSQKLLRNVLKSCGRRAYDVLTWVQAYDALEGNSLAKLQVVFGQNSAKARRMWQENRLAVSRTTPQYRFLRLNTLVDCSEFQLPKDAIADEHIPGLFRISRAFDHQRSEGYLKGAFILQDKSSCFPAHILAPQPGSSVIDACAAPGNKTTHLSALMGNTGKIYAFEKDAQRHAALDANIKRSNCKNVISFNADFLEANPENFRDVKGILLDPSCSGSGIRDRDPGDQEQRPPLDRLSRLSGFQIRILSHAFKFPNAERIVYSTCSIHSAENERVVARALFEQDVPERWKLAGREQVMPTWPRRGMQGFVTDSQGLLRVHPEEDGCNGFFVAMFVRN